MKVEKRIAYWLVLGGIIGPLLFVLGTVLGGFLRPHYSPMRQAISDLGVGHDDWVLNASLVAFGIGVGLFAIAFNYLVPHMKSRRFASVALGAFGILTGSAGVFQEPILHQPITITGILHFVLALFIAMPIFTIVTFVLGHQFRKQSGWERYGLYTTITAWLMVALLPLTFIFFNPNSSLYKIGVGGLFERLLSADFLAWFVVTSLLLIQKRGSQTRAE